MVTYKSLTALVLVGCMSAVSKGETILFVTTDQAGAQVQLDTNHTQYWTYTPTTNVDNVGGARFDMKRGSQTNDPITLDIIQGTFSSYPSATPLLSVTLTPSAFSTSYTPILFEGTPIDLAAATTYTAVLHSIAPDPQSKAYFIKGSTSPVYFVDRDGNPASPVPEPSSLCLAISLAVPAIVLLRRRGWRGNRI